MTRKKEWGKEKIRGTTHHEPGERSQRRHADTGIKTGRAKEIRHKDYQKDRVSARM